MAICNSSSGKARHFPRESEHNAHLKKNGAVYTPCELARYVADKTFEYFMKDVPNLGTRSIGEFVNSLRIVDPACGNGELLVATWEALIRNFRNTNRKGQSLVVHPSKILCGIDLDPKAVRNTKRRLAALASNTGIDRYKLITTNALFPMNKLPSSSGWRVVKRRFDADEGFDMLIANPPWGADTSSYRNNLLGGDFFLRRGQFDTSDLFLELALSIVKPGGYLAFIISDSLFNMERTALREMLLHQTEIKFIGRLGEKIFEKINRACALLICKNTAPSPKNRVDCLRLTPESKKRISLGKLSYEEADRLLSHKISQKRFANNKNYLFTIDVRRRDEKTLNVIRNSSVSFRDYAYSSRGIELSKIGKACLCRGCGSWFPFPVIPSPKCPHCAAEVRPSPSSTSYLVSKNKVDGYRPLLVGASVRRYNIACRNWIAPGIKGINYKDRSLYNGPKIVVRKTGVGISATIDYTNAFTNQVVYILKLRDPVNDFVSLEFLLSVMNSRAMYFYLVKSFGETEWRSHPYLTQQQILDFPLPTIPRNRRAFSAIRRITSLIEPHLKENGELTPVIDAEVEYLIATLYGLSRTDYNLIYEMLNNVQDLTPIRALKEISVTDIFG